MHTFARRLIGIAAVLGLGTAANAAFVPWSQPNGTVPGAFMYSGGGSDNGLFGSPIIAGTSFTFFPSNFKAQTNNPAAPQTTSDRLQVRLDVAPGVNFTGVTVTELGDYTIVNGGTVTADAFLYVTNLDIPVDLVTNPRTAAGHFANTTPSGSNATNNWSLQAITTLPNGWRSITLVLDNILNASVPPGGSALIEKKVGGIKIDINVPEPTTISAAIAGLGALAIRRRK